VRLDRLSAHLEGGASVRPLREEDVPELFALVDANREHLRAWLPWLDTTRREEDVRAFVVDACRKAAAGVSVQFAIVEAGRIVGVIGFHEIDWPHAQVGIGYWVAEDRQGRGLVTRAVRALVGMAFDELGLNRVEIHVATENTRSRAIPERLGFRHEGVLRQAERLYDRFVDLDAYSLIAVDWPEADR
jgi:ribosomal-protein-serine acetyltransferase